MHHATYLYLTLSPCGPLVRWRPTEGVAATPGRPPTVHPQQWDDEKLEYEGRFVKIRAQYEEASQRAQVGPVGSGAGGGGGGNTNIGAGSTREGLV